MTPQSLETFAESVNQPVTTLPDSKLVKVVAYERSMGEGSIITVPIDMIYFQPKWPYTSSVTTSRGL